MSYYPYFLECQDLRGDMSSRYYDSQDVFGEGAIEECKRAVAGCGQPRTHTGTCEVIDLLDDSQDVSTNRDTSLNSIGDDEGGVGFTDMSDGAGVAIVNNTSITLKASNANMDGMSSDGETKSVEVFIINDDDPPRLQSQNTGRLANSTKPSRILAPSRISHDAKPPNTIPPSGRDIRTSRSSSSSSSSSSNGTHTMEERNVILRINPHADELRPVLHGKRAYSYETTPMSSSSDDRGMSINADNLPTHMRDRSNLTHGIEVRSDKTECRLLFDTHERNKQAQYREFFFQLSEKVCSHLSVSEAMTRNRPQLAIPLSSSLSSSSSSSFHLWRTEERSLKLGDFLMVEPRLRLPPPPQQQQQQQQPSAVFQDGNYMTTNSNNINAPCSNGGDGGSTGLKRKRQCREVTVEGGQSTRRRTSINAEVSSDVEGGGGGSGSGSGSEGALRDYVHARAAANANTEYDHDDDDDEEEEEEEEEEELCLSGVIVERKSLSDIISSSAGEKGSPRAGTARHYTQEQRLRHSGLRGAFMLLEGHPKHAFDLNHIRPLVDREADLNHPDVIQNTHDMIAYTTAVVARNYDYSFNNTFPSTLTGGGVGGGGCQVRVLQAARVSNSAVLLTALCAATDFQQSQLQPMGGAPTPASSSSSRSSSSHSSASSADANEQVQVTLKAFHRYATSLGGARRGLESELRRNLHTAFTQASSRRGSGGRGGGGAELIERIVRRFGTWDALLRLYLTCYIYSSSSSSSSEVHLSDVLGFDCTRIYRAEMNCARLMLDLVVGGSNFDCHYLLPVPPESEATAMRGSVADGGGGGGGGGVGDDAEDHMYAVGRVSIQDSVVVWCTVRHRLLELSVLPPASNLPRTQTQTQTPQLHIHRQQSQRQQSQRPPPSSSRQESHTGSHHDQGTRVFACTEANYPIFHDCHVEAMRAVREVSACNLPDGSGSTASSCSHLLQQHQQQQQEHLHAGGVRKMTHVEVSVELAVVACMKEAFEQLSKQQFLVAWSSSVEPATTNSFHLTEPTVASSHAATGAAVRVIDDGDDASDVSEGAKTKKRAKKTKETTTACRSKSTTTSKKTKKTKALKPIEHSYCSYLVRTYRQPAVGLREAEAQSLTKHGGATSINSTRQLSQSVEDLNKEEEERVVRRYPLLRLQSVRVVDRRNHSIDSARDLETSYDGCLAPVPGAPRSTCTPTSLQTCVAVICGVDVVEALVAATSTHLCHRRHAAAAAANCPDVPRSQSLASDARSQGSGVSSIDMTAVTATATASGVQTKAPTRVGIFRDNATSCSIVADAIRILASRLPSEFMHYWRQLQKHQELVRIHLAQRNSHNGNEYHHRDGREKLIEKWYPRQFVIIVESLVNLHVPSSNELTKFNKAVTKELNSIASESNRYNCSSSSSSSRGSGSGVSGVGGRFAPWPGRPVISDFHAAREVSTSGEWLTQLFLAMTSVDFGWQCFLTKDAKETELYLLNLTHEVHRQSLLLYAS